MGHLAKLAGIELVVYDASDLLLGVDDEEDFERCIKEISHIRSCLQLHTQSSRRKTRVYTEEIVIKQEEHHNDSKMSDSDDSDDDWNKFIDSVNIYSFEFINFEIHCWFSLLIS